ncbi:MAG: V-type ATPase subunit [Candidatus Wallbacteria bacterium]|nr:V-type ATPase subunit [Candidatus Wallbacteria bacterium]
MSELCFLNAALRARSNLFLRMDCLDEMLRNPGAGSMIGILSGTRYAESLKHRQQIDCPVSRITSAIAAVVEEEISLTLKRAGDRIGSYLKLFLARWDILSLKAIFSCRIAGRKMENTRWFPSGVLNSRECLLLSRGGFKEAVATLQSRPEAIFRDCARLFGDPLVTGSVDRLCFTLDQCYFNHVFGGKNSRDAGLSQLQSAMRIELDRRNIMEVLHALMRGNGLEWRPASHFGSLSIGFLNRLAASGTVDDALEMLLSTPYSKAVQEGLLLYEHTGELSFIERLIEKKLQLFLRRESLLNPLSLALPLHYINHLINESLNLNLIALSPAYGLTPNLVRRELIIA